jgi:hypothetical protein
MGGQQLALVERTLLSAAFDLDPDFDVAGCPISRVLCEKWDFNATPTPCHPERSQRIPAL